MTRESTTSTRSRRTVAAIAVATAAIGFTVLPELPATAAADPSGAATAVTRAALDPALVSGRGADLGFVEQEAEKAATDGTIVGPGTRAYTLAAEASGRSAVRLAPGQYVEFTLPRPANAITVRYSIPDAPNGGTAGPWLAPWELPNTLTCDDRPTPVPPPAPAPW